MNKEQLKKVFANDLDIGHYVVMKYIQGKYDINDLWQIQKIRGWREALVRKNLLSEINGEFVLSDKANTILADIDASFIISVVAVDNEEDDVTPETPFVDFCTQLHEKIQKKIFELTQKKHHTNPSGKALNSSLKELTDRLISFFKKFGNVKYDLIEKAILKYTADAVNRKMKYPVRILFFIWKADNNNFITSEMLNYIEEIKDDGYTEELTERKTVNTKDLF